MTHKKPFSPILLIAGVPFFLMALSYGLFFLNSNNQLDVVGFTGIQTVGKLIQPAIRIDELNMQTLDGKPINREEWPANWTLMVLSKKDCSKCETNLVQSRQMHIALGKRANRLNRIQLLIDQPLSMEEQQIIKKDHPKLQLASISTHALSQLQAVDIDYLLVDPRGWVMMSYTADTEEKAMMSDLKHLFKYAQ